MAEPKQVFELAGHEVAISNPSKVFFSRAGITKLDMVRYYLSVAPGALAGVSERPMALKRFVNGAESEVQSHHGQPIAVQVLADDMVSRLRRPAS